MDSAGRSVRRRDLRRRGHNQGILDLGAQTLLVPMVDTGEQAAAVVVTATRYPPDGIRGVGAGLARASRWGLIIWM
ncbi:MAG: hypothetical protein A2Y38_06750 [Spirochaetes bacterium GWB1_59_5]|nr:MAG: hypothetical protein A2Y38_06750 [Spirochaetes bacterium GWB1_59_5]